MNAKYSSLRNNHPDGVFKWSYNVEESFMPEQIPHSASLRSE